MVQVDATVAPVVHKLLELGLREWRRDGVPLPDDVVGVLRSVEALAARRLVVVDLATLEPDDEFDGEAWCTKDEAALAIGVSARQVGNLANNGTLGFKLDGRRMLISSADVESYAASRETSSRKSSPVDRG